jgi:Na+/H+ antiporter NhaD/arsenite permease-like protein
MSMDAWIAAAIFVVAYVLIAIERWDRTVVAMIGGLLVVTIGVIDQHEAFAAIDLNVIFLLAGMMVIASVLARTGFFDWLAIRSVIFSGGHPIRLLLILATVTAVLSAFLDNVTTVVLMTPVILSVAHRLGISPVPYLISLILASNIGGTATLIGDPPNILIGSAAGLGFDDFLVNLAPVTVVVFLAYLVIVRIAFRGHLQVPDERREAALERTEDDAIKDKPLMVKALVVAGATIVGFLVHSVIGVEPATIALLGAMTLILVAGIDAHKALREIEWSTLFFFVGLFILVEAIVQVGIVGGIADRLAEATKGQPEAATLGLLWFSAIASAIIDNIPYTATAIPVVQRLAEGGMAVEPLWWALALGACLGGNLTIVGASANVVVSNVAQRAGHPIRFGEFLRYGSVVVLASMVISTAYLWLRYLA